MSTHRRWNGKTALLFVITSTMGLTANACRSFDAAEERKSEDDGGQPLSSNAIPDASGKDPGTETSRSTTEQVGDAAIAGCKSPETCPRIVFVTRDLYDANLGGVGGADAKCTSSGKASGNQAWIGKEFVAWVSVPGSHAIDRIWSEGRYVRTDGKTVSVSLEGLKNGLLNPISIDEYSSPIGTELKVWTGTQGDGNSIANCANWQKNDKDSRGKTGSAAEATGGWTDKGDTDCNQKARLYCFEK